ncbi:MAG: DUF3592 domain-containing protein [Oscillospiraceae bacterium]|nr:DUF3592 domain-containing protein [Oscillospiraceae bacterium]
MKIINKIKALKKEQLLAIAVGIVLIGFGIFRIISNDIIVSKGVAVNATITDSDGSHRELDEKADGRNDYDITYEYNGKTYTSRILDADTSVFKSKVTGDSVYIYIDPENPERIALTSTPFGFICVFAGVVAFGAAYMMGHKKESRYKNYE